nr:HDOD domain-containing protein [Desulfobulbaceae bacterium]
MENKVVSAGEYRIESSGKSLRLEALLGTCVAVAIYDSTANVGGLCHILLPDIDSHDNAWRPKCYASSALALFLDDLVKEGAAINSLTAVVAGGSLGFPFSEHDLNLDIGGRIAECANQFLVRHKIPIKSCETGGYYGMKMGLDTSNWQVKIAQMLPPTTKKTETVTPPTEEQIQNAIITAKPIPQITLQLIRLLHKDYYKLSEITDILGHEQLLTAKVISYCNTVHISSKIKIDTLERAVLILGELHLLELLISTSLKTFFDQMAGGYSLVRGGLFKHAIAVALLAQVIADKTQQVDPQTAYTAGLLHDIGKVVLDQYVALSMSDFYNTDAETKKGLLHTEQTIFRTDHQQIGKKLAVRWNIPENLSEVIASHHYPENAKVDSELLYVVNIADIVASWFMAGVELESLCSTVGFEKKLSHLNLKVTDLNDIISQVEWNKITSL